MVWLVFWIKYVTSNSISLFPVFLNVTARWTLTIEYSLLIGISSMAIESTFYLYRAALFLGIAQKRIDYSLRHINDGLEPSLWTLAANSIFI